MTKFLKSWYISHCSITLNNSLRVSLLLKRAKAEDNLRSEGEFSHLERWRLLSLLQCKRSITTKLIEHTRPIWVSLLRYSMQTKKCVKVRWCIISLSTIQSESDSNQLIFIVPHLISKAVLWLEYSNYINCRCINIFKDLLSIDSKSSLIFYVYFILNIFYYRWKKS